MRTAPLVLIALAGSLAAAEPATKPAPPIDPAAVTVRVSGVQFTRSVQYSAQSPTVPTDGQNVATITVKVGTSLDPSPLLAVTRTTFTRVVTDAGEDLALPAAPADEGRRHHRGFQRPTFPKEFRSRLPKEQLADLMALHAQGTVKMPLTTAKTLATVEGTCVVVVEAKPAEPIVLKPASEWVGKPREVPGSAAPLTIEKIDGGQVTLRYGNDLHERLKEIVFSDAAGKELSTRGTSGSGSDQHFTMTYTVPLPADGAVTVQLFGETAELEVPFAAAGLSLEPPPAKQRMPRDLRAPKPPESAQPAPPAPKPAPEF